MKSRMRALLSLLRYLWKSEESFMRVPELDPDGFLSMKEVNYQTHALEKQLNSRRKLYGVH